MDERRQQMGHMNMGASGSSVLQRVAACRSVLQRRADMDERRRQIGHINMGAPIIMSALICYGCANYYGCINYYGCHGTYSRVAACCIVLQWCSVLCSLLQRCTRYYR